MARLTSVFVSYSGRSAHDKDFAKRLLARLREQPLDPWIFERRGSEIPASLEIDEYCRKQIRQADVFVAVVSDSSLESGSTRIEVAFALKVSDPSDIVQIATTERPHNDWPEPYRDLLPYKRIFVKREDGADLERCVEDVCRRANVEYVPPNDGAPRLPLISRLTEEIRAAKPRYPRFDAGVFGELRLVARDAAIAYGERRLEHAFSALGALEHQLGMYYEGHAFYYPRLIRGVLLVELSPLNPQYLQDAKVLFEHMLEDSSIAPLVDENLYAALAMVHLRRGEIDDALSLYLKAHATVQLRGMIDADVVHNIVVTMLASKSPGRMNEVEQLLEEAKAVCATTDPYLHERLLALRAGLSAKRGDLDRARELLGEAKQPLALPHDVLARLAQDLASQPHLFADESSIRFVRQLFVLVGGVVPSDQRPAFLMSYAGFLYGLGQFVEALEGLQTAAELTAGHPKVVVEMVWCLMQLRRHPEATKLAAAAARQRMSSSVESSRADRTEFLYYRGFAAWLSGSEEQAQRDFLDSGFASNLSYSAIARRHFASRYKSFTGFFSLPESLLH
jgi:tetratricopeptide (TPR) repeat protein